jgi:hypothetical protein
MPDFVTLFSSLRTGEQEDGISSVDLPEGLVDGENAANRKLTPGQIRHMRHLLLNNADVEAS